MKHPWRGVLLLVLCLPALLSGSGQGSHPAMHRSGALDRDKGKEIFLHSCAACHGQDARGLPGLGKDLVDSDFVRRRSDEELVLFIERGRAVGDSLNTTGVPMPPKGGNPSLTREDLRAVVAYLRSLREE